MGRMIHPLVSAVGLASVLVWASSCGGTGAQLNPDGGERDGRGMRDRPAADGPEDGPEDGSTGDQPDGESDAQKCLTACEPDHCGAVPDNCGRLLECPACSEGFVCGILRPNRCDTPPSSCVPLAVEDACAGKCGAVSNGCDGVYECDASNGGVECSAGQVCGGFEGNLQPNTCVDLPGCTPTTCSQEGAECGEIGDGCGGVLDCNEGGGCQGGLVCGTGQNSNRCVQPTTCTPLTPAEACAGTCGTVSNGCGQTINCEADPATRCPAGTTCGGGGMPGVCGSGASSCTPFVETVACAGKCGTVSNGCGGVYVCGPGNGGVVCNANAGESCGGAGTPNQCGAPECTPLTQAQACPAGSCGLVSDGCNGLIQCGSCPQGQVCGLNTANRCAPVPTCQPIPVATACAGKCGVVPDGCGGSYTCNASNGGVTCTAPAFCGATQPNQCGTPPTTCTPMSCQQQGHTCGFASDGCGNQISCWPQGSNNQCPDPSSQACIADLNTGVQTCVQGTGGCTGPLCNNLPPSCPANSPTRLTGTVVTPGRGNPVVNRIPVPNVVVYIPGDPNVPLPTIFTGASSTNPAACDRCAEQLQVAPGQTVLASAVTDYRGQFTLEGRIPVGVPFNLVIRSGKWRRVVRIEPNPAVACQTRTLNIEQTRLNRSSTDGLAGTQLPRIAISTGEVDEIECVLRNLGIAESEFTLPSGNGRIHMYRAVRQDGSNRGGARLNGTLICTGTYRSQGQTRPCNETRNNTPNYGCVDGRAGCSWNDISVGDDQLFGNQATLNSYDIVVADCQGAAHDTLYNSLILNYVNGGGRLFASHWAYSYLDGNGALDNASDWRTDGDDDDSDTAFISLPTGDTQRAGANPMRSLVFRDWLTFLGALTGTTAGQTTPPVTPSFTETDARDLAGQSVGPSTDEWVFRVDPGDDLVNGTKWVQQLSFNTPYGAAANAICGRVAYSGFHVSGANNSDLTDFFPGVCSNGALTTQELVLAWALFDLSACISEGDPPTPPQCTPRTAADLCPQVNDACGFLPDGCGGVVDCGGCGNGFYCDGQVCRPNNCTPQTCASLGYNCGQHPDGCGGIARNAQGQPGCGDCNGNPQNCGLGGPGLCGSSSCVPIPRETACADGICGQVSDGCGGSYTCDPCPAGQVCGGGGPNRCGAGSCTPLTQQEACAGFNCGQVSDGCDGSHDCGTCTPPDSCGGAGQPNVCGHPVCTPLSPEQACQGFECGFASDGCGGTVNCGTCPNNGVCGGGGPNRCGGACIPTTCEAEGAECGAISDRCNGIIQCPSCPSGEICGAVSPNQCDPGPACTPRNCKDAGAECGLIGDGCGGVVDCGPCTGPGETCGGAGVANQCGVGPGGCNPISCEDQQVQCGAASNGCGGVLDCGSCGPGFICRLGQCERVQG